VSITSTPGEARSRALAEGASPSAADPDALLGEPPEGERFDVWQICHSNRLQRECSLSEMTGTGLCEAAQESESVLVPPDPSDSEAVSSRRSPTLRQRGVAAWPTGAAPLPCTGVFPLESSGDPRARAESLSGRATLGLLGLLEASFVLAPSASGGSLEELEDWLTRLLIAVRIAMVGFPLFALFAYFGRYAHPGLVAGAVGLAALQCGAEVILLRRGERLDGRILLPFDTGIAVVVSAVALLGAGAVEQIPLLMQGGGDYEARSKGTARWLGG
jgi:hypothetical protein